MREHVHEQAPVVVEQAAYLRQQLLPVAHVLEHLDRDDAVEAAVGLEAVHVGGDDLDAGKPETVDVRLLRCRVRHREHPAGRVPLGDPPG